MGLSWAILNVFSSLSGKDSLLTFLSCAGSSSALMGVHQLWFEQTCFQLIAMYYTKPQK